MIKRQKSANFLSPMAFSLQKDKVDELILLVLALPLQALSSSLSFQSLPFCKESSKRVFFLVGRFHTQTRSPSQRQAQLLTKAPQLSHRRLLKSNGVLDKDKPSLREAISMIRDLAEALDYAHSKGIIHREHRKSITLRRGLLRSLRRELI